MCIAQLFKASSLKKNRIANFNSLGAIKVLKKKILKCRKYFCFLKITRFDTGFMFHWLFKKVIFRSLAKITKRLWAILHVFTPTGLFPVKIILGDFMKS